MPPLRPFLLLLPFCKEELEFQIRMTSQKQTEQRVGLRFSSQGRQFMPRKPIFRKIFYLSSLKLGCDTAKAASFRLLRPLPSDGGCRSPRIFIYRLSITQWAPHFVRPGAAAAASAKRREDIWPPMEDGGGLASIRYLTPMPKDRE